tara:strand:+ start:394 stop:543 length:150 start_codon:yes stop_codon:yes gene_type:complete
VQGVVRASFFHAYMYARARARARAFSLVRVSTGKVSLRTAVRVGLVGPP